MPPEEAADLVVRLARGDADVLSGAFIDIRAGISTPRCQMPNGSGGKVYIGCVWVGMLKISRFRLGT